MKLKGYFVSCAVKTYTKKDGTEGKSIEAMFAVQGETDVIRVSTWRDKDWCLQQGIKTGAAGELRMHFGTNDRGYYEQVIWGFEPLEKQEATAAPNVAPQEKTPEMEAIAQEKLAAAQADAQAGTDLPF